MPLVTEDGWPQCSRDQCETLLVPGTKKVRLELRAGDVSTILTAWAAWWHRNVRPIEPRDGHRNWWAWSATNDVWNSNHLSGTAVDLCADELPWQRFTMGGDEIARVQRGLGLFEGHVYWGGNWNRVDQMHTQMSSSTLNNSRTAQFAQKLRDGYLNIYGPQDPKQFPLPPGYYYGPLDGPEESISGEYESDSQGARDGLGRWQQALGLAVTKKWDDGATPKAATVLQQQKGWKPYLAGLIYEGEWDAVIKDGWRLPADWDPDTIPDPIPLVTKWGDYSQYQKAYVDDSYPYRVICFRSSVADSTMRDQGSATGYAGTDNKFLENMRRARDMITRGRLDKVIAYHFLVPGADNWGATRQAIEDAGGVFPELALMLDVEDGGDKWHVAGDQTPLVKDWIAKAQAYLTNKQGVCLYLNFRSNASLIVGITDIELRGVKLIVPGYHPPPPYTPPGIVPFGHQYSDKENTPPFGRSDMNQTNLTLPAYLEAWGVNGAAVPPVVVPPAQLPPTTEIGLALIGEQFV